MLTGRPLYDNDADEHFFVVPEEWNRLLRAVERRSNVLLAGDRGLGKTTVLRQAQRALRSQGERVSFVDATAVNSAIELTERIRGALLGREEAARALKQLNSIAMVLTGDPSAPPANASRAMLTNLDAVAEAEPTIVLVDASGAGGAVYELFGRMRDTLWRMPHSWVVAVDETERLVALKPPADAFFDVVLRLDPWPTEALIELLQRRGAEELDQAEIREVAAKRT
jgi:Cdc6-like AAA superfamily ATPase